MKNYNNFVSNINEYDSFLENLNEDELIKELEMIIEDVSEGMSNFLETILSKILNFFNKIKTYSEKVYSIFNKLISKLISKLTPIKKTEFYNEINTLSNNINNILENDLSEFDIKDAIKIGLKKAKEKGFIPDTNLSNDETNKMFLKNKDSIIKILKEEVSIKLETTKQKIKEQLLNTDSEIDEKPQKSKFWSLVKNFSVGSSFMLVFGIIDNLGLFIGMDAIETSIIEMGFDSQVAAGFGNTFSDALGALLGGAVSWTLYKTLGLKGEGNTTQQFVGVIVGCLIPVSIKILFTLVG